MRPRLRNRRRAPDVLRVAREHRVRAEWAVATLEIRANRESQAHGSVPVEPAHVPREHVLWTRLVELPRMHP